jgi:hypothetical protein
VVRTLAEADPREELCRAPRRPFPRDERGQRHVLLCVEGGQQVEELEDEADAVAPQLGERPVVEPLERPAADGERPGARRVQRADEVEQRALP